MSQLTSETIVEKLEQLASQAERESMCGHTTGFRAARLRGYIEGLRDVMKLMEADSDKL
jgi:hypothetical protein